MESCLSGKRQEASADSPLFGLANYRPPFNYLGGFTPQGFKFQVGTRMSGSSGISESFGVSELGSKGFGKTLK